MMAFQGADPFSICGSPISQGSSHLHPSRTGGKKSHMPLGILTAGDWEVQPLLRDSCGLRKGEHTFWGSTSLLCRAPVGEEL